MTRPLAVRAAVRYDPPDYPGVPVCRDFSRRRYAPTVLDAIKNGLSRPLVVFGLFTCLSLPAAGDDKKKDDPGVQGEADPREKEKGERPEVRLLSQGEIEKLVCGIEKAQEEQDMPMPGRVAGRAGYLTEEEGRSLLAAFFAKNGFRVEMDARLRDRQVEFSVDGYDGASQVGFEYIGPQDPAAWEFQPVETDLGDAEARELDLAKARGGRAILVLDGRRYQYNVSYRADLPSKFEVIDRLLEDVRSFFVWLADQGRLAPIEEEEE